MALDLSFPYMAWNNLLNGATYTVLAGVDDLAHPLSNSFNSMMSSVATPQADANGTFSVVLNLQATQTGAGAFGGNSANALIVGASRHNPANQHWVGGVLTINGVEAHAMVEPANRAILIPFATTYSQTSVILSVTGLAANQIFLIPELFYGSLLQMPHPELGVDPVADVTHFTTFTSVSGFRYDHIHFVTWKETFHWKYIDAGLATFIEGFRERTLETMSPFWWVYDPYGAPQPVYVKHTKNTARMPFTSAVYRDFSLQLEEVLL